MIRLRRLRFRGGVHPAGHKQSTAEREIEPLPLPPRLYLPVQQHIGAPADPAVKPGDYVFKGQLLAHSEGAVSAPVHASTSGTVVTIEPFTAPHPSGLPVHTVVLEPDGKERWADRTYSSDALAMTPEEIAARVGAAGIVGMGGATFPAAVKLNLGSRHAVHTLVINGGECEPYLTCDDRLMQERPREIIDGVRIMLRALGARVARIAVEDNKPYAVAAMTAAAATHPEVRVTAVPTLYPMGSEKQMIQALTGLEVPAGKLSADIGIVVHNVATAHAVHRALRHDQPLISRIVTVGGGAVARPRNLEVPLGTLVSDLLDACGLKQAPARLLAGGPMMGLVLPHAQVPVVKGTNGIIALTRGDVSAGAVRPCIRCARCVDACPCGLMPLEMAARVRHGDIDGAVDYGVGDCIACGSCSYVCPANIPLVQYFNFAKGALANRREEQRKAEETRRLAEQRRARLEAAAQAKAAKGRQAEHSQAAGSV
ncbi:MAG: electron transport complex subunit RsxC [Gammaproteobacteria bacterium]